MKAWGSLIKSKYEVTLVYSAMLGISQLCLLTALSMPTRIVLFWISTVSAPPEKFQNELFFIPWHGHSKKMCEEKLGIFFL